MTEVFAMHLSMWLGNGRDKQRALVTWSTLQKVLFVFVLLTFGQFLFSFFFFQSNASVCWRYARQRWGGREFVYGRRESRLPPRTSGVGQDHLSTKGTLLEKNGFLYWFLRQDPPLDLSFWSCLTFLHHGIEEVERHLLWKFQKKIHRKSGSNVPPKLLACIRFLYKVVHKTAVSESSIALGRLNLTFFTAWTIFMKLGTLVHHVYGYKTLPQIF